MTTHIQHIVFDLGGVLIDWNPRYLYRTHFQTEAEVEWFLDHVCVGEWNVQMDGGRPMAEAIAEKQREFPQYAEQIGWWQSRWPEMLGGEITGTLDLLNQLEASGASLFALTNWSAETFPYARATIPLLQKFKHIVVSGEIGMLKPTREIFDYAAQTWGLEPASLLFIDDSAKNVAGAQGAGWNAIQFHSPEKLESDLVALGLL